MTGPVKSYRAGLRPSLCIDMIEVIHRRRPTPRMVVAEDLPGGLALYRCRKAGLVDHRGFTTAAGIELVVRAAARDPDQAREIRRRRMDDIRETIMSGAMR